MKTLKMLIVILSLAILTACHFGRRHTIIVENSNDHHLRIEYSGRVAFNSDNTAISNISPGGYVKYENDGRKLKAKRDRDGEIQYELDDDGQQLNMNESNKQFIAEAVRVMAQKGHNPGR
jgi:hypothetical protein